MRLIIAILSMLYFCVSIAFPTPLLGQYKLIKSENFDIGKYGNFDGAKRTQYNITVPLETNDDEVRKVLNNAVKDFIKNRKVDALAVHLFLEDGKLPYAIATWAPYGEWDQAETGTPKQYFETKIEIYFERRPKKDIKEFGDTIITRNAKLSKSAEEWSDKYIIMVIPKGTKAEILDKEDYGWGIIRVKVKININNKEYIGWVHIGDIE